MIMKEVMSPSSAWVDADDSVAHAAGIMEQREIAWLPVLNSGKVIGVITDRDLLAPSTDPDLDLTTARIREFLSEDAICCHANDVVSDVLAAMDQKDVSRAIVLDDSQRPIGFISFGEIWPEKYRGPHLGGSQWELPEARGSNELFRRSN